MRYAGMIENDVVNGGEGVAVSLFMQGCPHHCDGCFNPETWDFNGGKEISEQKLINKVMNAIDKNGIIRNLSILGGEPLCAENIGFVMKLIEEVKTEFSGIKVWVWTGYLFEELPKDYLRQVDVLIDGGFEQELKNITLPYRGSINQRVIDIPKTLKTNVITKWHNNSQ